MATDSHTLPLFPPAARPSAPIHTLGRYVTSHRLYEPSDVDEQHEAWGANCGPTAIAALLGRQVKDVREVVERVANGERRKGENGKWAGYMNAGHLIAALREFGRDSHRTNHAPNEGTWPKKGLAMIQIEGPWCHPPAKPTARFRYTHTVAVFDAGPPDGVLVYDGNAGMWGTAKWWGRMVMDHLVELEKRATGWHITTTFEIAT